jgi:hypothetical protein
MDVREELDRLYLDALQLNDRAVAIDNAIAADTTLSRDARDGMASEVSELMMTLATIRERITNALDPRR